MEFPIPFQASTIHPKYRGKIAIVGRNPEAIWFNDYEDRIIFDEAGLFTSGTGKPVY